MCCRRAEPCRNKRERETAVPREPAGGRRCHRRVQAARCETDDRAEGDLELAKGRKLAPLTVPKTSRTPPRSTTAHVPSRSESAPQTNDPTPMQRKLRSAAVEMPVRDQPIVPDMGW